MSAALGRGMRPALLSALMTLALAGCGSPGFSRLGAFQLHFASLGSAVAQASFDYDSQRMGCQSLGDDVSAVANGSPAIIVRGGADSARFGATGCLFPALQFTRPLLVSESIFLIADAGPDQLTVQVDGAGSRLTGAPLVTPGEVIHVGQRIQLKLGAGFERVQWPAFGGVYLEGQGGPTTVDLAPPSAGGVLDVQLPSTLPPGEQHVLVNLEVTPTFTLCDGPTRGCRWDSSLVLQATMDVPFQVQP